MKRREDLTKRSRAISIVAKLFQSCRSSGTPAGAYVDISEDGKNNGGLDLRHALLQHLADDLRDVAR